MSVTPTNIAQGPAVLWYAAYGTATPADSAVTSPPGASWTDVGGTQGGVNLAVDNTYTPQEVDQLVDPVGARLTKRAITLTVTLAEASLANLQLACNELLTLSVNTGYTTTDLQTTTSATQPTYATLIIDGWAPTTGTTEVSCRRRIIMWKSLSQAKIGLGYEMAKNVVYDCVFTSYYVSSSISPVHIIDQTS
jgi:hypothetical protein